MVRPQPTLADLLERATINDVASNCVNWISFYGILGSSFGLSLLAGIWWLAPLGTLVALFDAWNHTQSSLKKIREIKDSPDAWMKYSGVAQERLLAADLDTPLDVLDAQRLEGVEGVEGLLLKTPEPSDSECLPELPPGQARIYDSTVLEHIAARLTKHVLFFAPTQSGKTTFLRHFIRLIQKYRRPQRILYCTTKQDDAMPFGVEAYFMEDAQDFYDYLQVINRLREERRRNKDRSEVWIFIDEWETQIDSIGLSLERPEVKEALGIMRRFLSEASGLGLKLGLITQSGNLEELKLGSGGKAYNLACFALGSEDSGYDALRLTHRSFGHIPASTRGFLNTLREGYWIFAPYKGEQILIPGVPADLNLKLVPLKDWDTRLAEPKSGLLNQVKQGIDYARAWLTYEDMGQFEQEKNAAKVAATLASLKREYLEKIYPEAKSLSDVVDRFGTKLERRGLIAKRRVQYVRDWLIQNELPLPGIQNDEPPDLNGDNFPVRSPFPTSPD